MITDAFVQEDGLAYDADSITVKLNKEDVTKDCKITVDGNKFKMKLERTSQMKTRLR